MGAIRQPKPVKLIVALLARNQHWMTRAREMLDPLFGPVEETLEPIPFHWTHYYQKEVGAHPLRSFVSYEPLIRREELAGIKNLTNDLEGMFAEGDKRPVNLDPGVMTLGQFFLASTKDQRQRVYTSRGIFVEPSLYFKEGCFHPFSWTYPDYQSEEYRRFFLLARSKLAYQLKHGRPYSKRK